MKRESFQGILLGIVIMCAVFAFITIAWAAFSTNLNISGTASVSKQSWQIDFTDQKDTDFAGRLTATSGSDLPLTPSIASGSLFVANTTSGTQFRISSADTVQGTLGEFKVGGDKVTYTWYAQNFGSFAADVSVFTVGGLTTSANLAGGNITLVCTKTSSGDMNVWCNGAGDGSGTGTGNDKAHMKATLSVGAVTSSAAYATGNTTWNNLSAKTSTSDDSDILEIKLEVEFLNLAGSGENPTTSDENITVSIPAMVLKAVQHTGS